MKLKTLGRYELIRVLGKGAMGLVYEARDPNLDRKVAIKTIRVDNLSEEEAADYEVRFRTEARSAGRLQHPNIVSVYDSDRDIDIAYMVMEFIQGDDLKHHLDKGDRYTLRQVAAIMGDLLSALDYAHRQNVVHRDIKPANLLIEASGRVKLTDFGVARIQDSGDATRTQGTMVGTLKYMSPEQVHGRATDSRSDLFAAGIVLYQLLTGRRPFDGSGDYDIIQQILNKQAEPPSTYNPALPAQVDAVIARALQKSRDDRYPTAKEFNDALQAAALSATDPLAAAPSNPAGPTDNSSWTATLVRGEALVNTHSGTASPVPAAALAPATSAPHSSTLAPEPTETRINPPPAHKKRGWMLALAGVVLISAAGLGYQRWAHRTAAPFAAVSPPSHAQPSKQAPAADTDKAQDAKAAGKAPPPPNSNAPAKSAPTKKAAGSNEADSASAAGPGPAKECQDRNFLTYQLCLTQQCNKPQYTKLALCVQRRAMEQRNLDGLQGNGR